MRKLCLLLVFLILPFLVYAQNIPQPSGWVNDFAGVISPEYKEKLNSLIEELEQKTTAEIAVVTINSIAPYDEKEYARLLFDNWKPGKKGKDNGVLVLLAVKERRWRIETGYGVEGVLPDGLCGEIGRNYMVPYFKEGQYAEGLLSGVKQISNVLTGKTSSTSIYSSESFMLDSSILFLLSVLIYSVLPWILALLFLAFLIAALAYLKKFELLFMIVPLFIFISIIKDVKVKSRKGYKNIASDGWWGGGGFGGGGGGGFGGGGGGGGGAGGGF